MLRTERFGELGFGADLSREHWRLLHWVLTDTGINPGINDPRVSGVVKRSADLIETLADGGVVSVSVATAVEEEARKLADSLPVSTVKDAAWGAAEAADCACYATLGDDRIRHSACCVLSAAAWKSPGKVHTESEAWNRISARLVELIQESE